MARIIFLLLCWQFLVTTNAVSQNDTIATLFRNSFTAFELMRNDIGNYRDSKVFNGSDFHPASVANIGMGLISLCIADEMEWIDDAEEQVLITLKSITGNTPSFNPDRNATGFFRHWIDMDTGSQAWSSEYSTIDSGILTSGVLFCKKYFCENDSIKFYADQLWNSIDWSKAIQNPATGGIYLEMQANGEGVPNSVTLPFNEYMIVAWLAMNQESDNPSVATELWNNHYANPSSLLTKDYNGIPVLTDNPDNFLSSFVVQFPFYLCHYFTTNSSYLQFFENARQADSLWWANEQIGDFFHWGLGAGSSNLSGGYHPDAINNNATHIYSPHIISGFLPSNPNDTISLLELYKEGESIYTLPAPESNEILWRKSLDSLNFNANEVSGVDFSTMIFGLASLPEFLGVDFFIENNDFFNEPCGTPTGLDEQNFADGFKVNVFPNPTSGRFFLEIEGNFENKINIVLFNSIGQIVFEKEIQNNNVSATSTELNNFQKGIYFIEVISGRNKTIKKLSVQ